MSYISLLAQAGKAAAPYLKPLGIRLGKSICTGVLTQLAGKYAFRITGDHILAQRDRDIREAVQRDLELKEIMTKQKIAMAKQQEEN
nr:MAG TPA: hypothetical protein [Caudoviricetes sp.]